MTHSILNLVEFSQEKNDVYKDDCKSDHDHWNVTVKIESKTCVKNPFKYMRDTFLQFYIWISPKVLISE